MDRSLCIRIYESIIVLYSYILLLRPNLRREPLVALDHQIREVDRIPNSDAVGRSALKDPTGDMKSVGRQVASRHRGSPRVPQSVDPRPLRLLEQQPIIRSLHRHLQVLLIPLRPRLGLGRDLREDTGEPGQRLRGPSGVFRVGGGGCCVFWWGGEGVVDDEGEGGCDGCVAPC